MEILNGIKGEASYSIKIEDSKVKMMVDYDGQQADASIAISLGVDEYLDMLAEAIPGEIDDKVIALIKAAMS